MSEYYVNSLPCILWFYADFAYLPICFVFTSLTGCCTQYTLNSIFYEIAC